MDTVEKQELTTRTRQRNALTWLSLDYSGIMAPLVGMETDLNTLAAPSIENSIVISDEAWGIKEDQRDRTVELSQAEVDQDRAIADAKVAMGRTKIAIERAADEYVLAAKVYDARVKGLIMEAKEYAALVEQEQLAVEEAKSGLAVDKESLRLKKVKADIYLENIQQAQVEADLAKSQVEVAKAHIRAAMAGIEVGKVKIDLVEAEVQEYMVEVDKATLQADVATIWSEIVTKKLSETKLGVGRAEIVAGFKYIQSKLDDALALYDVRKLTEEIKTETEKILQEEDVLELKALKGKIKDLVIQPGDYTDPDSMELTWESMGSPEVDLRIFEGDSEIRVNNAVQRYFEVYYVPREGIERFRKLETLLGLLTTTTEGKIEEENVRSAAQEIINAAHKGTYQMSTSNTINLTHETEYISGS